MLLSLPVSGLPPVEEHVERRATVVLRQITTANPEKFITSVCLFTKMLTVYGSYI